MKLFIGISLTVLFVTFAATAAMVLDLRLYADYPISAEPVEKTVMVSAGQAFSTVINFLSEDGLVKKPLRFKMLARAMGYDKRIKAGEYRLSTGMSPLQVLEKLVKEGVRSYSLDMIRPEQNCRCRGPWRLGGQKNFSGHGPG